VQVLTEFLLHPVAALSDVVELRRVCILQVHESAHGLARHFFVGVLLIKDGFSRYLLIVRESFLRVGIHLLLQLLVNYGLAERRDLVLSDAIIH